MSRNNYPAERERRQVVPSARKLENNAKRGKACKLGAKHRRKETCNKHQLRELL